MLAQPQQSSWAEPQLDGLLGKTSTSTSRLAKNNLLWSQRYVLKIQHIHCQGPSMEGSRRADDQGRGHGSVMDIFGYAKVLELVLPKERLTPIRTLKLPKHVCLTKHSKTQRHNTSRSKERQAKERRDEQRKQGQKGRTWHRPTDRSTDRPTEGTINERSKSYVKEPRPSERAEERTSRRTPASEPHQLHCVCNRASILCTIVFGSNCEWYDFLAIRKLRRPLSLARFRTCRLRLCRDLELQCCF